MGLFDLFKTLKDKRMQDKVWNIRYDLSRAAAFKQGLKEYENIKYTNEEIKKIKSRIKKIDVESLIG